LRSLRHKTVSEMGLCSTGGFFRLLAVIMLTAILVGGCSHIDEGTLSQEANQFFNQGNYGAALGKYEQLIANYPAVEDRVLFEMGIVYAYPKNAQKDYQKSLDCFQKIVKDYPDSEYRYDSQMMILQIHNVIIKDQKIAAQQAALENVPASVGKQSG
jgi:outer membrane protein assembly factor BamD (BamD/ComL family)